MGRFTDEQILEMIKLYEKEEYTLRMIGEIYGADKSTVSKALRGHGVEIKRNPKWSNHKKGARAERNPNWRSDIDTNEVIRLYMEELLSMGEIAKRLNCDRHVISKRIHDSGVDISRRPRIDKAKDNTPAKNKLFYKYKYQAERRNILFNLSKEDFLELVNKECHYCGNGFTSKEVTTSGHIIEYNGIDRVDNTKGYMIDNVVPCCKICNAMKSNLDYDMFVKQIRKIGEHLNGIYEAR